MNRIVFILAFCFAQQVANAQYSDTVLYNEVNYREISRGFNEMTWVVRKVFKFDSTYTFERSSLDSLYSDTSFLMIKRFLHHDLLEGPYFVYSRGKLERKGWYHHSKFHGKQTEYQKGGVYEVSFYANGKRVGTWVKYYDNGAVSRKTYYSDSGKFMRLELYDRNTGRLYKTEFKDAAAY